MSLEVNPVGVTCNLACPYCYEHPMRDAGNYGAEYDLEKMKAALGSEFTLFGGEPLLMKWPDLVELLRWGKTQYGKSSIQTNGALITPEHVALFKECNVGVGLSMDGPDELNDSRWAGTLEKTREATRRSMAAIDLLQAAGLAPSLIVTLHRGNASPERLPRLLEWLRELDVKGVAACRLHVLEIDHALVRTGMALTEDENVAALEACANLQYDLHTLRFDLFEDMAHLLTGVGDSACVWNACDPLTTPAVQGVSGQGVKTNCSRTNKDGVDWVKSDTPGHERYLALYETPQADGGCQGCRFFFACKGQCPGTAIDGDWRNRSESCRVWYRLFERVERDLVRVGQQPVSSDPLRRAAAEKAVLEGPPANRDHQDHWDAPHGYEHADGYYWVHGDHGTKMHGDSANPPAPHADTGIVTDSAACNGFASEIEMDRAHKMVLDALTDARGLEVLDLGAGDGTLLRKLKAKGAVFCVGLEQDEVKVKVAQRLGTDVRHGRIEDYVPTESFGAALISRRRFDEMGPEQAAALRARLRGMVADLYVYSYDEPRSIRKEQP